MEFNFKPNSVITLVGISHSGKTTYAEKLKEKLIKQGFTCTIISSDAIRRQLLGLSSDDNVRTKLGMTVSQQAFSILFNTLEANCTYPVNTDYIIVDTTGLSESFRNDVLEVTNKHHYASYMVLFELPEQLALSRNKQDSMISVIKQQSKKLKESVYSHLNSKNYLKIFKIKKELEDFSVVAESSGVRVFKNQFDHQLAIIGDVHECVETLKKLILKIETYFSTKNVTLYSICLLGDWIDKNDKTKELVEYLDSRPDLILVKGNHENWVARKLNDNSFVYSLNEETKHFSSIVPLLADKELSETFLKLYAKAYDYISYNTASFQLIATHSPCLNKYLNKKDSKSLKYMFKQDFNWDVPVLDQVDYLFKEANLILPLHVFGHVNVNKTSHTYKNKISIDQACVEGGYLTAAIFNQSSTKPEFIYEQSENFNLEVQPKDFNYCLSKFKKLDTKKYENLDPFVIKQINRLMLQGNKYMSPTMTPSPSYINHDLSVYNLEGIDTAISYFLSKGITKVIAQTKFMGSRAQSYITPKLEDCYAISRNGWKIKDCEWLQKALKEQWLQYKDKIQGDLLILDNELMPWSALGLGLIDKSFTPYYECNKEELIFLQELNFNGIDDIDLKLEKLEKFKNQLDIHSCECDPYFKCFGVIFNNGKSLLKTSLSVVNTEYNIPFVSFDLSSEEDCLALKSYYSSEIKDYTKEGIVVKPDVWDEKVVPYMKIRNPEYLRLVYGSDYDTNLKSLSMSKNISRKASTSNKEQVLNEKLLVATEEEKFNLYADILNEFSVEKTLDPRL